MTQERTIATLIHGRYLLERGATAGADPPLLVGCHGYGENASRMLAELKQVPGAERFLLCAVEGLHRFYNPKTQEVLGSWMTKEGREHAMADNVRYLASVIAEARREEGAGKGLIFAGFSQGVAMAYRAAAGCGFQVHGLVALAGDVPGDVGARELRGFPPVLLGRGTGDTWYTEEIMARDLETLAGRGVEVETCVFDAGHVWTAEFREAAGAFLERVLGAPGAGSSETVGD